MSNMVIFESGDQPVQVRLEGETVWLSQAQIAKLFGTSTDNISLHLKNMYTDKELEEPATTEDFSVVRQDDARQVKRQLKHYNLDAAHLLYFVIKNHPLADGNKRTGAFLFLWYLRLNQHLLARPVERLVNEIPWWRWRCWWPRASRSRRN